MAAMSRSSAGRMRGMAGKQRALASAGIEPALSQTKRPGERPGRVASAVSGLTAVAEEPKEEHEQVDEVEIERQRAHYSLAADNRAVIHRVIHVLDALGIPGGHSGEDEHAHAGDDEVERPGIHAKGSENDVDQHG